MAGKILIVDDVATNRIVLKVKLSGARYETIQAHTGAEALRLIAQESPDLVLLDVQLPDMNGIDICRTLKANPATARIPVIIITAFPNAQIRLAAMRAGADDFLVKPYDELVLLARLRSLMRTSETDQELLQRETTYREMGLGEPPLPGIEFPFQICLVAQSRDVALSWKTALARHLPQARLTILERDEVLAAAAAPRGPDAFVIAADLGRPGDGLPLMSELRSRAGSRYAVICIAVRDIARETSAVALDLGASDLLSANLSTPEAAEEAALRLRRQILRKRRHDQSRDLVADGLRLALIDPLTGLYNRRYAMPHIARLAERARYTGRPFAVMVLDLDHFKAVNDTFGHAAGDAVLVEVAQRLSSNLRQVDLVARVGGEEFLVAMPETSLDNARIAAERLCRVMEQTPIALPDGRTIHITVSIGLALGGGPLETAPVTEVISRADRALLGSKAEGRNQVKIFDLSIAS